MSADAIADVMAVPGAQPTSLVEVLLYVMAGAFGMVAVALIGWAGLRVLRRAQAGNEDASAEQRRAEAARIEAETWGLMKTNALEEMQRLTAATTELRNSLGSMHQKFDTAMDHIVEIHEWDARGRQGPMPELPAGLKHRAA